MTVSSMSGRRVEVEAPRHPVGAVRWTYIPDFSGRGPGQWERCKVADVYGRVGCRYGPYPELYDVRRPNGEVSRAHFPTSLTGIPPRLTPDSETGEQA